MLRVVRFVIFAASSASCLCLIGCNSLPPLQDSPSASTEQIITRVKCEVAQAVYPYLRGERRNENPWLERWNAEVDLTLVVSDVTGLATGIQLNDQLHPAVLKGIGSF